MNIGDIERWRFQGWPRRPNRPALATMFGVSLALSVCTSSLLWAGTDLYVAPNGNDTWSGALPESNGTDGPLATLTGARDKIRQLRKEGMTPPFSVYFREGIYRQSNRVVFIADLDSGNPGAPICYRSYPGERATISAGAVIRGTWVPSIHPSIYEMDISNYLAQHPHFNTLFINGNKAIRARSPNTGYFFIKSVDPENRDVAFRFNGTDIQSGWHDLRNVEIVSLRQWECSRFRIDAISGEKVYFQGILDGQSAYDWDYWWYGAGWATHPSRYYVENCLEALDSPGEWYLDQLNQKLFYWPRPGEDLNMAEVTAPVLINIIHISGWTGRLASYIEFRDLTFSQTDWSLPVNGLTRSKDVIKDIGAITIPSSEHLVFDNNEFQGIGTNAFAGYITKNITISRNLFHDISGQALFLWNMESNSIVDNTIFHIGTDFPDASGMLISGGEGGNLIARNEIYDSPYCGINFSLPWYSDTVQHPPTIIEFNHIHDVMKELNDGAGFYMGGMSSNPGINPNAGPTIVRNNLIHDVRTTPNHVSKFFACGVYLDERTTKATITNNIVYNCGTSLMLHMALGNSVTNNIFSSARDDYFLTYRNRNLQYLPNIEGNTITRNIFYSDQDIKLIDIPVSSGGTIDSTRNNVKYSDYNHYFRTYSPTMNWNLPWWQTQRYDEQSTYYDINSTFGDPLFRDPDNGDYTLLPNSPVLQPDGIGFQPIDVFTSGPRSRIPIVTVPYNQTNLTTLTANWYYSSPDLVEFEYQILASPFGSAEIIQGWTSAGLNRRTTTPILPLISGMNYYFAVRARLINNDYSEPGYSAQILYTAGGGASPSNIVEWINLKNTFVPSKGEVLNIQFNLTSSAPVSLKIYSRRGAMVKTIWEGGGEAGMNTFTWDGRNSSQALVSSGVYLLQLEARGETITKKLVVVK